MPAHAEAIMDLAVTPNKKTMITTDKTGQIKIWDLNKPDAGAAHTSRATRKECRSWRSAPRATASSRRATITW